MTSKQLSCSGGRLKSNAFDIIEHQKINHQKKISLKLGKEIMILVVDFQLSIWQADKILKKSKM